MSAPSQTTLEDIYPDSDGKPMAETGIHVVAIIWLYSMLRHYFHGRDDVYIAADMYLYYVEGQPKKRRAPDVMIAKGVKGNHERRSFKTWVEGVTPACIFEVTSKKTTHEDLKLKKPTYQRIGVREYFMFDPLRDYLPEQLIGYRLVAKKYQRIKPGPDGSLLSKELGLRLLPEGTKVALFESNTGARIPTTEELFQAHEELDELKKERDELQAEIARLKRQRNGSST